jgi:hypothetical protein
MTGAARNRRLSPQGAWGLGILAAAALLLGTAAALPHAWFARTEARLAEARAEFAFLEARLGADKSVRKRQLTAADNVDSLFMPGTTSGLAQAEMQGLVGRLAQQHGMVVERSQPLPAEVRDGIAVLRMDVEASGSLENLRGYLLAVETGEPLIFVTRAKIAVDESRIDEAALPSDRLAVALQLEAYGWWEAAP